MADPGAKQKQEGTKSIWNVDHENVTERIEARRDRIRKRIDAAKRLTKLMKIQKMMGFKCDDEEEAFVKVAAERGSMNIHTMNNSGQELVSNVRLAGEFLQVKHRMMMMMMMMMIMMMMIMMMMMMVMMMVMVMMMMMMINGI